MGVRILTQVPHRPKLVFFPLHDTYADIIAFIHLPSSSQKKIHNYSFICHTIEWPITLVCPRLRGLHNAELSVLKPKISQANWDESVTGAPVLRVGEEGCTTRARETYGNIRWNSKFKAFSESQTLSFTSWSQSHGRTVCPCNLLKELHLIF